MSAPISYKTMLQWMLAIFAEYTDPITIRQLFYQFVARQFLPNLTSSYKKVSRDCTTARELGHVPTSAIEDRNREAFGGDYGWDDNAEIYIKETVEGLRDKHYYYKYPRWVGQPKYVEVWVEKAALQGIVQSVAGQFNVKSCAGKGFSSFTFVHDAASRFSEQMDDGKECKILYFGDFDPSGECMVTDLIERVNRYGAEDVTIEKISLTRQQVLDWKLPYDATKVGDSRSKKFIEVNGDMAVELDAIPPDKLRELISGAINDNIDQKIWINNYNYHEKEREKIRKWCRNLSVTSDKEYAPQNRWEI
jgi:hypothetical protein